MEIQKISVLSSSVAFLLRQRLREIELQREDLEGLLTPPASVAQTADGRFVFTSVADQMEVLVGGNRVDIGDLSRQLPRSAKIAKVGNGILVALKADARAYGINYEFEIPVPNGQSGEFLLNAFARHDLRNYVGGLKGVGLTLFFDLDDREVRIKIEPRRKRPESDKIFVNVNIHKALADGEQVPEENQLAEEVGSYFERVKGILSSIPT